MSEQEPGFNEDSPAPVERILLYPFAIVDAWLHEWFILKKSAKSVFTVKRILFTNASVRYTCHLPKAPDVGVIADIDVRVGNERATYVRYSWGNALSTSDARAFQEFFDAMLGVGLSDDVERVLEMIRETEEARNNPIFKSTLDEATLTAAADRLAGLPLPHKLGSHISWPEDNWAWEEVNIKKRPRLKVRAEWMERLSEKRELRDKPRSFRYAVNPKRKEKRKAEGEAEGLRIFRASAMLQTDINKATE